MAPTLKRLVDEIHQRSLWRALTTYADLVALSGDTFNVPVSGIADLRVDRTIVEGWTVHRRDRSGLDGD